MALALVVTRCPDSVAPERRVLHAGGLTIGRGLDNDWILPDPGRHLSKRHCQIDWHDGGWELSDLSANGTFVNHAAAPVGRGAPRVLRDGDCLSLGAYDMTVSLVADAPVPAEEDPLPGTGPVVAARVVPERRAMPPAPMQAFLRGAGLDHAHGSDPLRVLAAAGQALRAAVAGIRQALVAVATTKNEFRIERTMVKANGNNPLKFSAGDDDALAACLGLGPGDTMPGANAITEALRAIRLHEGATLVAMQAGVRALLTRFDPAAIARQADSGGIGLLASTRKARCWAAFEKTYSTVSQELSDDFDSVFGKAFARAYEDAMRDQQAREPP